MPIDQSLLYRARRASGGGALSQGILQGIQGAQLIKQTQLLSQKQQLTQDTSLVGNLSSIFGNKSLPVSMRTKALNQYIDFSNDRFKSKYSKITEADFVNNDATFSKLSTKLLGIKKQFEDGSLNAREVRAAAAGLNLEFSRDFQEAEKGGKLIEAFTKPFQRKKPVVKQPAPFTIGRTRFTGGGEPIVTAPPEQPTFLDKQKLEVELQTLDVRLKELAQRGSASQQKTQRNFNVAFKNIIQTHEKLLELLPEETANSITKNALGSLMDTEDVDVGAIREAFNPKKQEKEEEDSGIFDAIRDFFGFGKNDTAPTLPPGVTEDDIEFTAEKHGLTREEVMKRLGNAP